WVLVSRAFLRAREERPCSQTSCACWSRRFSCCKWVEVNPRGLRSPSPGRGMPTKCLHPPCPCLRALASGPGWRTAAFLSARRGSIGLSLAVTCVGRGQEPSQHPEYQSPPGFPGCSALLAWRRRLDGGIGRTRWCCGSFTGDRRECPSQPTL